jgi:hypothetical protein
MRTPEEPIYSPAVANEETPVDAPFAHVSIEVGHFEPESFRRGVHHFANRLERVRPWLAAARTAWPGRQSKASTSTCFLIDDYAEPIRPPSKVIPRLLEAARQCGITIDYLVRESALAEPTGPSVAEFVEKQMERKFLTTRRDAPPSPSAAEWLSDGAHWPPPPSADDPAVNDVTETVSPNSILLDAELWAENVSGRQWSCSFLAAVWQLSRLGLLSDMSRSYLAPQKWDENGAMPGWNDLPPVMQINDHAAPFQAYRTVSILGTRYLRVETAVRAILKQVHIEAGALELIAAHSQREDIELPGQVADRINYIFVDM